MAFLEEMSRARAAALKAEVRAELAEEEGRIYRRLAIRDAETVQMCCLALDKLRRVEGCLDLGRAKRLVAEALKLASRPLTDRMYKQVMENHEQEVRILKALGDLPVALPN